MVHSYEVSSERIPNRTRKGNLQKVTQELREAGDDVVNRYLAIAPLLASTSAAGQRTQGEANTGLYLTCLDEMNLSQVEHYFSDFMMGLERRGQNRTIQCFSPEGAGECCPYRKWARLSLPPSIRFVGTVNFDETTRLLSDLNYLDSARGRTKLLLQSKSEDAPQEAWRDLLSLTIYVLPSKLGEERYQAMTADLQEVSQNLLVDLYGKSRQSADIRYSKKGQSRRSHEQELRSIESVIERLGPLLQSIGIRPASRVRLTKHPQQYWGGERIVPVAWTDIAAKGINPAWAERPIRFVGLKKAESFDVPEHRFVQAFRPNSPVVRRMFPTHPPQ